MEMEKKNLAIILLAVVLAASGIGNVLLAIAGGFFEVIPPKREQDMVFGTTQGDIVDLDPHYSYDTASNDAIDQVVETLYVFNISDPEGGYPIVPALATAWPSITPDGLEYTINLRQGVTYHDGTDFNATTVKWSFDRLMHFMNYSGNKYWPAPFNESLPDGILPTQIGILYQTADGRPIINETEVVSEYIVRFHLNEKKASFLPILTYTGSGAISPASTPPNRYYGLHEKLVGTGPFMYKHFTAGVEIKFAPNPDYWDGPTKLTSLTYSIITDLTTMCQALLSGDIDLVDTLLPAFIDQFDKDPDIELVMAGNTLTTMWVTFNYDRIPDVMRKAMSYALNYSYIIDVVYEGVALRWPTYIPMGILYANYSLDYAIFNRLTARTLLLEDDVYGPILENAGISLASSDSAWKGVTLESYNYTWNIGNDLRRDTGDRLAHDLEYIGIKLESNGVAWGDLLEAIKVKRDQLDLYSLGWAPDYLDPENYINPIWSNTSLINGGNFYEPDVQALMNDGLTETNEVKREWIYDEIQRLMVEEYYPAMTCTTGINYDAWRVGVKGWISNPMARTWFYPVYFD